MPVPKLGGTLLATLTIHKCKTAGALQAPPEDSFETQPHADAQQCLHPFLSQTAHCYGLNLVSPNNLYAEAPTPGQLRLETGSLKRRLEADFGTQRGVLP